MAGEAVLNITFPFNRACDICHRPKKSLYRIMLDGIPVFVCTEQHAIIARDRWMEKKKLNLNPYQPKMKETSMMEEGNIPEPGGEE